MADLSQRTWETHEDVQLLEDGWREGHGHYYLYNEMCSHVSSKSKGSEVINLVGGSEIRVQLVHFVMTEWKSYFTLRIKN